MLPRTVRGLVGVAAELAEEVGKRVVGTAAGLLERGGIDLSAVERRLGGQFPPSAEQLQTLAGEAVTAGRAGVDLAVGVARSEVEKAFEKVGDQVTKVGVVLSYLEGRLREGEDDTAAGGSAARTAPEPAAGGAPAPRAEGLFGHGWDRETDGPAPAPVVAERVVVDDDGPSPAEAPAAEPAAKSAAPETDGAATRKTAAKRPAAKKSPAKKTAAKRTTTARTATAKATAAKAAGKKAAAKKAAAKKAAAEPEAPAKRTSTKKTTVRRTTSTRKQPDA